MDTDLTKPVAPFMLGSPDASDTSPIPRTSSLPSFRAPFLSPSSRPTSSLWAPPSYPLTSPNPSSTALPPLPPTKPPLPSTRLTAPLQKHDKPWLARPDRGDRLSYLLTLLFIVLGFLAAAALAFLGYSSAPLIDPKHLCLVMEDHFTSPTLDDSIWNYDVELGGFGNGEFEMTTKYDDNVFTSNGNLYIYPTLSENRIPNLTDGGNFTLDDCTFGSQTSSSTNSSSSSSTPCSASSSASQNLIIPPIMSGRLTTKSKKTLTYGRVEVSAKLPKGDWLWPAIWLLPQDNTYGPWPVSGEIDILEARGNDPSYESQGRNYVRSTLTYGPLTTVYRRIYGWWSLKRAAFDQKFHKYVLEWDQSFIRIYVDSRLQSMLEISQIGKGAHKTSFWDQADFPLIATNSTSSDATVLTTNPYSNGGSPSAPFDQPFFLIINLSVGGTSGWFPDGKGGKPWVDAAANAAQNARQTAMRDFWKAKDQWYPTWPESRDERGFRMFVLLFSRDFLLIFCFFGSDYVKMWQKC